MMLCSVLDVIFVLLPLSPVDIAFPLIFTEVASKSAW